MKTETKLLDKAVDTLIDEAAVNLSYKEAEEIMVEDVEFSPEHTKRMEKLFRKEHRRYNLRRATRVAGRVACILLVVVGAFTVAISSVEAWRVKFLNFIFEHEAPDTKVEFTDTKQDPFYNDVIEMGYIPEGFELEGNQVSKRTVFLKFKNKDKYFQLKMNTLSLNVAVNTEKGAVENLTINGYEGVYIIQNEVNILIWHDGNFTYRLAGNVEKEELVKIAKEIRAK